MQVGRTAAVAGASGYAGGELLRLLLGHPELEHRRARGRHRRRRGRSPSCTPSCRSSPDHASPPTDAGRARRGRRGLPRAAARPVGRAGRRAARPDLLVVDLRRRLPARRRRPPGRASTAATHAGTWPYGLPELPGARERARRRATRIAEPRLLPDRGRPSALAPAARRRAGRARRRRGRRRLRHLRRRPGGQGRTCSAAR